MDEFGLIDAFFKSIPMLRKDVVFGIGDDAACVSVPPDKKLLVSTDTLVSGVHFLPEWDPADIAYRSVAVNASDIAAMAGMPCWITLALTLPEVQESWLSAFAKGLGNALKEYQIDLIGGDTTKGPLTITITIMGLAEETHVVRRGTAKQGDKIYVSGVLGGAALAVKSLQRNDFPAQEKEALMNKLLHPKARVDFVPLLRRYASAAIDISDGLSADLHHICHQSGLGAKIIARNIPIHPLVTTYLKNENIDFALSGGDDYELCFTIPAHLEGRFQNELNQAGMDCYYIGEMESEKGIRLVMPDEQIVRYKPKGYMHF